MQFFGRVLILSQFLILISCGKGFQAPSNSNQSIPIDLELKLASDEVLMGDMIVTKDQILEEDEEYIEDDGNDDTLIYEGVSAASHKKWPNGILPIAFASNISTSRRNKVFQYCLELGQYANVKCVKRTKQSDFIKIKKLNSEASCGWSMLGRIGGRQDLAIDVDCWNSRIIQHELMHALGISHEQNHPNRGDFIKIYWNRILDGYSHNFARLKDKIRAKTNYDYKSIMHYHSWTFSKNDKPTMLTKSGDYIYNNETMSLKDHKILWKLYGGTKP